MEVNFFFKKKKPIFYSTNKKDQIASIKESLTSPIVSGKNNKLKLVIQLTHFFTTLIISVLIIEEFLEETSSNNLMFVDLNLPTTSKLPKLKQSSHPWLSLQTNINKYKAKKILWGVAQTNSNFKRFLLQNNISQIKSDSLDDQLMKKINNSSVLSGFTHYFDKIEKEKIKQFDKEMEKVYDEFNYYGFNSKEEKELKVKINIPYQRLSRVSEDLSRFEEKYGKFSKITNENRIKSKAIDHLCSRLGKKIGGKM